MRKILLLFLLPLGLIAEVKSGTGQWHSGGQVKELFSTPFGQVYRFSPNEGNGTIVGCAPLHPDDPRCRCGFCRNAHARITSVLTLKLPSKIKITNKFRYVALDFRIRVFPALDEHRTTSALTIHLLDSGRPIHGAAHTELHGSKTIRDHAQDDFYYSGQVPLILSNEGKKNLRQNNRIIGYGANARYFIHPAFEPLSVRVIYDLAGRKMTYSLNGQSYQHPGVIGGKSFRPDLRYFGLAVYGAVPGKPVRYQYFELSAPQVHLCDDLFELSPAPVFEPYPYGNYLLDRSQESEEAVYRKVMHHKNPDLQYAYALRYLYGEGECDPEKGLKLLEKAAKEHHALALYQLGVCHWRGYGVRPNKDAARFLRQSMNLGYPEASALLALMEIRKLGLPWFRQERYDQFLKKVREHTPSYGHDEHFLTNTAEFLSTKRLLTGDCDLYFSRDNPKLNYLDHELNNKESFAFLPKALKLGYTEQETLLQDALHRKRYEAYPYLLMSRILKNKIPEEKDITEDMILRLGDDPLFLFCLELIRMSPEERMKYLRKTGGGLAIRPSGEWQKKNPEADFLRAVRRAAAVSRPRPLCMSFPGREPLEIFERIKSAADRGHPAAQYLTGKFYFHNDLPEPYLAKIAESETLPTAEKYLAAAAKQGSVPAALLLCRAKLASEFPKYEAVLPLLENLCRRKIGEAFYLKAETLLHLNRKTEALSAAKLAVENGDHRGWRIPALHGGSAVQRDCWRKFIVADREARRQDVYDFYWSKPYGEYLKWETKSESGSGDGGFSRTPLLESQPKVSAAAAEETSETGSKDSSKKSSRKKEKGRSKIKIRDK